MQQEKQLRAAFWRRTRSLKPFLRISDTAHFDNLCGCPFFHIREWWMNRFLINLQTSSRTLIFYIWAAFFRFQRWLPLAVCNYFNLQELCAMIKIPFNQFENNNCVVYAACAADTDFFVCTFASSFFLKFELYYNLISLHIMNYFRLYKHRINLYL